MIRTITKKVTWVGRATVFSVGLAVTLALLFGVATAALAAVPGDPFRLGEANAINAASRLTGTVAGPLLSFENQSPGSKAAPASALSLEVQTGNSPLTVNPEAGTAKNLSADELDGKDSTQFLATGGKAADADRLDGLDQGAFLRTTGKAADADKLDGKDATAFYPTKTYRKVLDVSGAGGGDMVFAFQGLRCDPGDKLLTGGAGSEGAFFQNDFLVKSSPHDEGWYALMRDNQEANFLRMEVICADFPPLRP